MDSPHSVVSPFKSSIIAEPGKQRSDFFARTGSLTKGTEANRKESVMSDLENFIGVLEVYIHQARDIQNICIYQKQDVYAKLCLTSDPENTVSTKIINGGGRNPVFNENLKLNVKTVESSLKCEIFMMSRVKNYLGDQLLGFTLVPLSEVLVKNGKLEKEFSLSSTDLFHSPAGFVQLSLAYAGASPDVLAISAVPKPLATNETTQESEISESLDRIEFPDPKQNPRLYNKHRVTLLSLLRLSVIFIRRFFVSPREREAAVMLVYQDLLTGDELLSDSFPYKEIENGVLWEVEGKWVVQGAVDVDIGANPSAEGGDEDEGVDDQSVKVVDIVDTFRLQEQPAFDKKQFVTYIKRFIKLLTPKLSEERQEIFKKNIEGATKFLLSKLSDLQFFVGESMHDDGCLVFAYYKEGATDPTFLYFADALKEVKC